VSFHPRKSISVGEGGMVITDDKTVADHVRVLRAHGATVSDLERHKAKGQIYEEYRELGYNYRMTDIQAAIGIEQMKRLDGLLAKRRQVALRYTSEFGKLDQVQTPAEPAYAKHSYQSYVIRLRQGCRVSRDELIRELVDSGISSRKGIAPAHLEPLYLARGRVSLPVTEAVAQQSLFLPLYASLAESDQARIIDTVVRIVTR
jgi:perosamine synthetase